MIIELNFLWIILVILCYSIGINLFGGIFYGKWLYIWGEKNLNVFIDLLTNNPDNLGIPGNGSKYMKMGYHQDLMKEFLKQNKFLRNVFLERVVDEAPELADPNGKLEFINYGDTQMVYVLTANDKQWAVLVTQPALECGFGKREYDNLQRLAEFCPELIVKPEYYFTDGNKEYI